MTSDLIDVLAAETGRTPGAVAPLARRIVWHVGRLRPLFRAWQVRNLSPEETRRMYYHEECLARMLTEAELRWELHTCGTLPALCLKTPRSGRSNLPQTPWRGWGV